MFQEYPRHVHKAGGLVRIVVSDADKTAALAEGWSLTPVAPIANPPMRLLWLSWMPGGERLELREHYDVTTTHTTRQLILIKTNHKEHILVDHEDVS